MNIVYLVFGKDLSNHKQAVFSILTLLPYKNTFNNIVVVTDTPEYYNSVNDSKIIIEQISSKQLTDWKGGHNYIFRAKIKAIELVAHKWPHKSLLYLDADTFVFNDLDIIRQKLDEGCHIMHLNEGSLYETKSNTKRAIWNSLKYKNYQKIVVDKQSSMWNAGVIGISSFSIESAIAKVLAVSDEICEENVNMRLVEQLSFSLVLSKCANLLPAANIIGHYWGNKSEWNRIINDFFIESYLSNISFNDMVTKVGKINLMKIPVFVKTSSTSNRLKMVKNKLFVKKNVDFVSTISPE